jgi:hypothetical protein
MHKKGVYAKKWIKIDPDLGAKKIFFPRTQRTLPKPIKKPSYAQKWQPLPSPEMSIFGF